MWKPQCGTFCCLHITEMEPQFFEFLFCTFLKCFQWFKERDICSLWHAVVNFTNFIKDVCWWNRYVLNLLPAGKEEVCAVPWWIIWLRWGHHNKGTQMWQELQAHGEDGLLNIKYWLSFQRLDWFPATHGAHCVFFAPAPIACHFKWPGPSQQIKQFADWAHRAKFR